MIKKILKTLGIVLLIVVGIALAAPFIFKNKIIALVKKEINDNVNAKVDFTNVNISFFRNFPKVAIGLEGLQVLGTDEFAADTLLSAERIDASVDIMSLIRGSEMNIYSVVAASPRVHAIIGKSGLANWDIMKPADSTVAAKEAKPFKLQLQRYAINNGYISYVDELAGISSEISRLNHEGTGDFTADLFTLKTNTTADAVTVVYGGIPYLSNANALVKADIDIDNKKNEYRFNTNEIIVNQLQLSSKGTVKNLDDKGYDMDITFKAPSTDFKNILSMIPAIYQHDFKNIKTSGTTIFSGFLKGIYSETQLPAYHVDVQVKDGFFNIPICQNL